MNDQSLLNPEQKHATIMLDEALRQYLLRRRHLLIMELGEVEDLLKLPRSIVPRRKRGKPPAEK